MSILELGGRGGGHPIGGGDETVPSYIDIKHTSINYSREIA